MGRLQLMYLLFAVGCGRVAFDPLGGTAAFDAPIDDTIDMAAVSNVLRIGDRPDADLQNVTIDTYLDDTLPTLNFGAHADFHVETDARVPGLIRFAIAGITTRSITGAQLHLWVYDNPIEGATVVQAFSVLEQWDEGTGNQDPGAPNYTDRAIGTPWTTAGANVPGSRSPTPIGQATGPIADEAELVIDLSVATVSAWITSPATNFGIALILSNAAGDYSELYAGENGDVGKRPMLALTLADQ